MQILIQNAWDGAGYGTYLAKFPRNVIAAGPRIMLGIEKLWLLTIPYVKSKFVSLAQSGTKKANISRFIFTSSILFLVHNFYPG